MKRKEKTWFLGMCGALVVAFWLVFPWAAFDNTRTENRGPDGENAATFHSGPEAVSNGSEEDDSLPCVRSLDGFSLPAWIPATSDPENKKLHVGQMNFSRYQKAVGPPQRDKEASSAYNHGAKSKLTLRVVDESGNVVSGAKVSVAYCHNWNFVKAESFTTGAEGIIVLEHPKADQYRIGVSKNGYYDRFGEIHFYSAYHKCVDDGRWIPWNPHVDFLLKSVGSPVRLRDYDVDIHDETGLFPLDCDIPFDLLAGDFLPPFGGGTNTNVFVRVSGFFRKDRRRTKTELRFPDGGGVSMIPKDGFCDFKYPKRIDREDFRAEFVHERLWTDEGGVVRRTETDPTVRQCVALRVPVLAATGTTNFLFGVLSSPPRARISESGEGFRSFSVQYLLNPILGDGNIESPDQLRQ